MCCVPTKPEKDNNICIYCGSQSHTSGKCTSRPNDNREEPRPTLRGLQECRFGNTGNSNHFHNQNRGGHQQARSDKRSNRQYSPNHNNYQPSPLGSIPGQDLSTTLINLANIQSRSLEIMVKNQRSQQKSLNEVTRANKDKANDVMFASIKTYNGTNRRHFKEWIDKIDQACRISGCDLRTEIIKKYTGAVCNVVMTSKNCSDDKLLLKLIKLVFQMPPS